MSGIIRMVDADLRIVDLRIVDLRIVDLIIKEHTLTVTDSPQPEADGPETSTQPVLVVAVITGKPGTGDELEPLLQLLAAGTHTEKGCLLYSLQRGIDNTDQFVTVEKWTSGEALSDHLKTEHVQSALSSATDLLAEPPMIIPTLPVVAGDPAKAAY